MFVIKQAGIGMATMSDLKTQAKQTLAAAQDARIYVLNDGKPVAGIVSLEIMSLVEDLLEDQALAKVAQERVTAVESGSEALLDEDDFFAQADAMLAAGSAIATPKKGARSATGSARTRKTRR